MASYSEANIPARFHRLDWTDLKDSEALAQVRTWSDGFPDRWCPPTAVSESVGWGMVLTGPPGTGKTTAAAMVLKAATDLGKAGWFVSAPTLESLLHRQMDISKLMGTKDNIEDETLTEFEAIGTRLSKARRRYMLVVIDDWARERMASAFLQDFIEGLLRERFDRGLPTILTTNVSEGDLSGALTAPFMSFLTDGFRFVEFAGERHRRNGAGRHR